MIAGVLRSDGHIVFEARDGSALACDLQFAWWERHVVLTLGDARVRRW
jgi:hypothetical protein